METFNPELFLSTLALIGVVIVISALLSGLVERSGLPQVAVFLGLGGVIGPSGLGLINVDLHSPILRVVGTLSLVLVLFTDAVSLNLAEVRKNKLLSTLVVGPGTLVTAVVVALFAWLLLALSPPEAMIVGAAIASTDPIMLRSLVRKPGIDSAVRQALRLEGGMNDAVLLPIVLFALALLSGNRSMPASAWVRLGEQILVLSPAAGVIVGLGAVGMLELVRRRIGVRRDYESIYSLGVAFAAFAAGEAVHGSGYLAAFAAGLTISALDVELCDCFLEYGETTAEMALMFSFVLFGISVIWTGLNIISVAMLLFVGAVFIARPIALIPALLATNLSWKNRWTIAWFGPRALSTLLLVLLPVFAGLPHSGYLLQICCLVVLFSVVIHGISPSFIRASSEPDAAASGAAPQPEAPLLAPTSNEPLPERAGVPAPEFITIEEVKALQNRPEGVDIVDSRSERTYEESDEVIPGSVRLHPDRAVALANSYGLSKDKTLAVLCA